MKSDAKTSETDEQSKQIVRHVKEHGHICYSGHGHLCPVSNCEVNFDPHNIGLIIKIVARGDYV